MKPARKTIAPGVPEVKYLSKCRKRLQMPELKIISEGIMDILWVARFSEEYPFIAPDDNRVLNREWYFASRYLIIVQNITAII